MDVFVYGTLTDPDRVAATLDRFAFGPDATLVGLDRATGRYPTLVPPTRPAGDGDGDSDGDGDRDAADRTPGRRERPPRVEGRILSTPGVAALDDYEGVDRGLYVRVSVPRAGGDPVDTYVGDPDRLGVGATWPGGGSLEERVRRFVASEGIEVRERPADG